MNIKFSKGQWVVLWGVGILLSLVSVWIGLTMREHIDHSNVYNLGGTRYYCWTFSSLTMTFAIPIILLGGLLFLSLNNKDK